MGRRWREGARRSSIKETKARDRAPRREGPLGKNQKERIYLKSLFLITGTSEVPKYADSLRNLNLGEVGMLQYDLVDRSDQLLYSKIKEFAPDFIVYVGGVFGKQPSIAALAHITNNIAPMIHLCSDAADQPWWDLLRRYREGGAFMLQVAIDGSHKWPHGDRDMTALTPVDPALFPSELKPHAERVTMCGFAGNQGGGPISKRTVLLCELLSRRAIDLRIRSSLPYTYEAYCEYLATLRISLNIAHTGTESTTHVKGRVLETALAGACLLETKGSPTSYWFRPGLDYLEYDSPQEAFDIIKRLAEHPAATQAMGESLRRRVLAEHSPAQFWNRIFERIGMKAAA